jgi:hypothetical protein
MMLRSRGWSGFGSTLDQLLNVTLIFVELASTRL